MQVFVSYSRVDRDAARKVADILHRKDIRYFLDERDIQWGDPVDATISSALDRISHLVVLISPASVKSQWVAYEIGLAKGKGVQVLPFLLHPSIDVPSFISDLNFKTRFEEIEEYFTASMALEIPPDVTRALRIAVIPKGELLEFWNFVQAGAIDAAVDLSRVEIEWKNQFRESDTAGQNLAIEECINGEYDGICVAAIHSTETRRAIDRVTAAGIPVLVYDSGLDDETNIVSYVATDNYSAGQRAGHKMAEVLGNEGQVAVVRYKTGSRSTEERESGFLDVIRSYPDIRTITDGMQISDDRRVITAVADRIVRHGEQLNGVFCPIEFATSGVLGALKKSSRTSSIKIIGFDANASTVDALRAGELSTLIIQDPFQIGSLAVRIMVNHLMGRPVQNEYKVPCAVATRENLDTPHISKLLKLG